MDKYKYFYNFAGSLGCKAVENFPMNTCTTFKIGGNAALYIEAETPAALTDLIQELSDKKLDYIVIGKGSNIVVNDKGLDKVVIRLTGEFAEVKRIDDNTLYCGAGLSLAGLCREAENKGLSGLEFAWGIPGSVGGAVFMNAGAYGGEMKDVVYSVNHIDRNGNFGTIKSYDLDFSYRHSVYKDNGCIIIGATFRLTPDSRDAIRRRMDDYMGRRKDKQPLDYPSAGSVFRRPEGAYAGALIQQCGLKGYSIGGAQVSEKHAGFIINKGGATAEDVKALVEHIQKTVKEKTGYYLNREIIYLD